MGIEGFNTWFHSVHANAYVRLHDTRVDHLYIDMNSVLHVVIRKATNVKQFHRLLHRHLELLIKGVKPRKTVMMAVDGPAPLAKLLTQRSRRKAQSMKEKRAGTRKKQPSSLSSTALTPGTTMMLDVTTSLTAFVAAWYVKNSHATHVQFEISGATVKGEGEVKILGRLARPWPHVQPTDSHMFFGGDADLVLMALLGNLDNLYVCQTDLSVERNPQVLSVKKLRSLWMPMLSTALRSGAAPGSLPEEKLDEAALVLGLKADFACLAIMTKGNDYLPGLRELAWSGFSRRTAWSWYDNMRRQPQWAHRGLVKRNAKGEVTLDVEFLCSLLQGCTRGGASVSVDSSSASLALPADTAEDAEGVESGDEPTLAFVECGGPPNATEYMRGLLWVLQMYFTGQCQDYGYIYEREPPSVGKLISFLQQKKPLLGMADLPQKSEAGNSLLPHVCAMALLPEGGKEWAPRALQPLMEPGSSVYDLFDECQTCLEISTQFREATLNMIHAGEKLNIAKKNGSLEEVTKWTEEKDKMKEIFREVEARRSQHLKEMHPSNGFDLPRLVAAVNEVPEANYAPHELLLTRFGHAHLYRHIRFGGSRNAAACQAPPSPWFLGEREGLYLIRYAVVERETDIEVAPDWEPLQTNYYTLTEEQHPPWTPTVDPRGHPQRQHHVGAAVMRHWYHPAPNHQAQHYPAGQVFAPEWLQPSITPPLDEGAQISPGSWPGPPPPTGSIPVIKLSAAKRDGKKSPTRSTQPSPITGPPSAPQAIRAPPQPATPSQAPSHQHPRRKRRTRKGASNPLSPEQSESGQTSIAGGQTIPHIPPKQQHSKKGTSPRIGRSGNKDKGPTGPSQPPPFPGNVVFRKALKDVQNADGAARTSTPGLQPTRNGVKVEELAQTVSQSPSLSAVPVVQEGRIALSHISHDPIWGPQGPSLPPSRKNSGAHVLQGVRQELTGVLVGPAVSSLFPPEIGPAPSALPQPRLLNPDVPQVRPSYSSGPLVRGAVPRSVIPQANRTPTRGSKYIHLPH